MRKYTFEGWPFAVSPQDKLVTTWGEIKRSTEGRSEFHSLVQIYVKCMGDFQEMLEANRLISGR
ncbi:TPA: hypothetical protein EYP66_16080 [Candidatus Poribacteria bacterium]|nr:hypothetical protein [Candidatus Poribacteria bacterium]